VEEWQIAVDRLYAQYKKNGVICEDDIYNTAEEMNLPLLKLEKICSVLNSKGVYISNHRDDSKSDDEAFDYAQSDYNLIFNTALELSPTLFPFVSQLKEVVPPQRNELSGLLLQIRSGNTYARERAIAMYIRMVIRIAVGYVYKTEVPLEDLVSEGTIGLMTAIDRYDESVHGYFSSYASLWIRQVIDRYVMYQKSLIHIPVHVYDMLLQIEKIIEPYPFDESQSNKQFLAENFNISICEVERAMLLLSPMISIDDDDYNEQDEINQDEIFFDDDSFEDKYPQEFCTSKLEDENDKNELKIQLLEGMKTLSEKERSILLLRYGMMNNIEYTLEQVGNHYGVTRERIRQIEAKALRKMRHPSGTRHFKGYY